MGNETKDSKATPDYIVTSVKYTHWFKRSWKFFEQASVTWYSKTVTKISEYSCPTQLKCINWDII